VISFLYLLKTRYLRSLHLSSATGYMAKVAKVAKHFQFGRPPSFSDMAPLAALAAFTEFVTFCG
jgi:hypothetical protein